MPRGTTPNDIARTKKEGSAPTRLRSLTREQSDQRFREKIERQKKNLRFNSAARSFRLTKAKP